MFADSEPLVPIFGFQLLGIGKGWAKTRWPVMPSLRNPIGVITGQMAAMLADLGVYASLMRVNASDRTPTYVMTVKFLKPVLPEDEALVATALAGRIRTAKDGKRKSIIVRVEIRSEKIGNLKASAKVRFSIMPETVVQMFIERERSELLAKSAKN